MIADDSRCRYPRSLKLVSPTEQPALNVAKAAPLCQREQWCKSTSEDGERDRWMQERSDGRCGDRCVRWRRQTLSFSFSAAMHNIVSTHMTMVFARTHPNEIE